MTAHILQESQNVRKTTQLNQNLKYKNHGVQSKRRRSHICIIEAENTMVREFIDGKLLLQQMISVDNVCLPIKGGNKIGEKKDKVCIVVIPIK